MMARHERPSARGPSTKVDHETEEPEDDSPSRSEWLTRGQKIGRYHVLECLGVGGMGVIYSAWDPQLERKLAIKLVRVRNGRIGSARSRARLAREGQALARLRHPNVIAVYDVGAHDDRVFVAMEFVEGKTVQRWLHRSPSPLVRELVDVFLQVGRGLAAAHRAGLVHRDVKPENVMIGDDGRVLVLDFGIAREGFGSESDEIEAPGTKELAEPEPDDDDDDDLDALPIPIPIPPEWAGPPTVPHELEPNEHPRLASLTRAGAVVGTPAYMSPEQHRGQPVDPRGDQFSFCVAMWEALNGEKPYGEGTREKLLARMRLGQLRPFHNRQVPRRIAVALRRGLSWTPDQRHPSMEALLEALNPRGPSAERRLWHGLAIGATAGLVLGIVATIMSINPTPPGGEAPSDCTHARAELGARWSDTRAKAIGQRFHASGLARADASWVRTRERLDNWAQRWSSAREHACTAHFVERHDSAERHDRRVACLEHQRDRFSDLLGRLEQAPDAALIDGAVIAAIGLPSPESCAAPEQLGQPIFAPKSPVARQRLAELERERDRLQLRLQLDGDRDLDLRERPADWHEAIERSRQLATAARELDHPPLLIQALLLHAAFLERDDAPAGQPPDQTQAQAQALLIEAAGTAAATGDLRTQAQVMISAAGSISARGHHAEARRWLELAMAMAVGLTDDPALQISRLTTRATIDRREGQLELARAGFDAAVALLERHGDTQLQLPAVVHALGSVHAELGDDAEAVRLLRRALVLYEQGFGPAHPRVAAARDDLARSLEAMGEPDAALGEYQRALALFEALYAGSSRTSGGSTRVRSHIGALLARQGRCDEARAPLARAVADTRADAPGSLGLACALEAQAQACALSHPDPLASVLAHEAVEIRERIQGSAHPQLAAALEIEALALLETDEPQAALTRLDRAVALLAHARPDPGPVQRSRLSAARGLTLLALGRDDEARAPLELAAAGLDPASELGAAVDQALAARP